MTKRKPKFGRRYGGAPTDPEEDVGPPPAPAPAPHKRRSDAVLAAKIRMLRTGAGISGEDLGHQIGKSQSRISKWENCEGHPTARELLGLSRVFGVPLEFLCDPEITNMSEIERSEISKEDEEILRLVRRIGHDDATDRLLGITKEDAGQPETKPYQEPKVRPVVMTSIRKRRKK